jgi:hypothetical protein
MAEAIERQTAGRDTARVLSSRLARWVSRLGEGLSYLCGSGALIVILRHISGLVGLVTVGPFHSVNPDSEYGLAVFSLWTRLGFRWVIGRDDVLLAGLLLVPAAVWTTWRLNRSRGLRAAVVVAQLAVGLVAIAYSYRLLALVAFTIGIAWQLLGRGPASGGWGVWVLSMILCASPVDVTIRRTSGPPRWARAVSCSTEESLEGLRRGELRDVCVEFGQNLYVRPRLLWVW